MQKKPARSQQKLAKTYHVTPKTITRWRQAGAPLHDPDGMALWLEQGRRTAALPGTATARQADHRAEYYRVQALRVALKLEKEKGLLLRSDMVSDSIARGMAGLFSELERAFVDRLPAVAKGRSEAEVRDFAIKSIEGLKAALREAWSKPGAFDREVAR